MTAAAEAAARLEELWNGIATTRGEMVLADLGHGDDEILRQLSARFAEQRGDEARPPGRIMRSPPDRREVPRDVPRIARPAAVEQPVQRQLGRVVADVLGVGAEAEASKRQALASAALKVSMPVFAS